MTSALIIAAGKTPRKSGFKPQKKVGTIPAIQRIVRIFQRAGIEHIVVVCDNKKDQTKKLAAHMNLVFLHCRKDAEMLDNIKAGLAYLQSKCSAVLITHVDVPLFSAKTVRALLEAGKPVCVPSYRGRAGHPMLLRAEHFHDILSYSGDNGLAGAVEASGLQRYFVEVEDPGILSDINKKSYGSLLVKHDLEKMHFDFRLRLMKEKIFYGPGAHQLLQLTEETGSLRLACRRMGISYSKGRKIIADMEKQTGYPVIESQQGGKTGGHSTVTKNGKALMDGYTAFYNEAKECLNQLFLKHFTL